VNPYQRSSIFPLRTGFALMMYKPPRCSLASTNGPSVVRSAPFVDAPTCVQPPPATGRTIRTEVRARRQARAYDEVASHYDAIWQGSLRDADNHLASGVSPSHVSNRLRRLGQLIRPVDHRRHFAGLDELSKREQVVEVDFRNKERKLLSRKWSHQLESDNGAEAVRTVVVNQRAVGSEHTAGAGDTAGACVIKDHVVLQSAAREVLACVIDDMLGTDRLDEFNVSGTADTGDFGSEGPGDLHSERSHAT